MPDGLRKGPLNGPATMKALNQGMARKSELALPLDKGHGSTLPSGSDWSGEGPFNAPAISVEAGLNCPRVESKPPFPFRYAESLPIELQHSIATGIVGLLPIGGPSNIAGLIAPIVVDAIQGKARWARTKMRQKGRKGVTPFRTHGDAPATIARISLSPLIEASPLGFAPRAILPGFALHHGDYYTRNGARCSSFSASCWPSYGPGSSHLSAMEATR